MGKEKILEIKCYVFFEQDKTCLDNMFHILLLWDLEEFLFCGVLLWWRIKLSHALLKKKKTHSENTMAETTLQSLLVLPANITEYGKK